MSRDELDQAIAGYLRHAGADTVENIWNGLGRPASQAAIRAGLKRLGLSIRQFGNWPRTFVNAWGESERCNAYYPEKFTLYYAPGTGPRR
jgi:hypothetical protein